MLQMIGVRDLVLGSSGNGGLEAAKRLENLLKTGASTTVAVDGPAGPPLVVKKGALHMAANCDLVLVPISFHLEKPVLLNKTWDIKRFPRPFSKVVVTAGDPIILEDSESVDEATTKLAANL